MANLTITQVAARHNIKPDTLRYYERVGLLPPIPRQANGNRYFDEQMQDWIEMIICLRHSGISVEALVDYAQMLQQGDATLAAREQLLREQLELLQTKKSDLNRSIKRLEHKISLYETGAIKQHKNCFEAYQIPDDPQRSSNF